MLSNNAFCLFSCLIRHIFLYVSLQRVSFIVSETQQTDKCSPLSGFLVKKEEQDKDDDFTFDEPCPKKQKTSRACLGHPAALLSSEAQTLRNELNMNWDLIEVFQCDLLCLIFPLFTFLICSEILDWKYRNWDAGVKILIYFTSVML